METAQQWYDRGIQEYEAGNYEAALASFDRALEIQPDSPQAWCYKGNCLWYLGRYEEALDCYGQALRIDPNDSTACAWNGKGLVLNALGRYEEGLVYLEQAIAKQPDNYNAWNNYGIVLHGLGRCKEALASYEKAIEINPNDSDPWHGKGNVLKELGDSEKALLCYEKALGIKPDAYIIWHNKGNLLKDCGCYEAALACYEKALIIKPEYSISWDAKGRVLKVLRRYKEAQSSYKQALQLQPQNYDDWITKGDVFSELLQYEKSLYCYNYALNLQGKGYYATWRKKAFALYKLRRYHEALQLQQKILEVQPESYDDWLRIGDTLSALERYREALYSYNRAVALRSSDSSAWNKKGNIFYSLKKYKQALRCHKKATKIQPNYYFAWYGQGSVFYMLSQYQEAIDAYDHALQLTNNQDWMAWANRALAVSYLDGYEARIQNYNNGLQALQPDNPAYNEGCGYLHWQKGKAQYQHGKEHTQYMPDWFDARNSYQQALKFLTAPHLRLQRLEVLQDLIQVYRALNQTQDVQVLLAEATDLLGRLLQEMSLDADKIRLSRKFASLVQLRVDELAHSPEPTHPIKALELAEERKNLCLRWLRYGTYKSTEESPSYEQMQHLLNPHTAIIYWHISPAAITTFILGHEQPLQVLKPRNLATDDNHPQSPPPSFQQLLKFEDWLKTWKQDYQAYRQFDQRRNQANSRDGGNPQPCIPSDEEKRWIKTMPKSLNRLKELLNIPGIVQYLKQHCPSVTHLILVPHRDLHLLPIHALFPDKFTITYLPSIKVGLDNQQRKATQRTQPLSFSLLSVENPLGDLKYASLESAAICQLYPQPHRLPKSRATLSAIQQAFSQPINIFHFSGHGEHNLEHPHQSHLKLANDEEFILKDIFAADLSHCHLVCLSACETGLTSQSGLIDEFVGLASGFLAAGVTHIVGSLWNVNDLSTTFLMLKFHETLQENPDDVSRALRQAQYWLKNATKRELKPMIKRLPLKSSSRIKLNKFLNKIDDNRKPFASPFYWAAFCTIG
ncbi:tetratricopeptide repeat protein [Coleofasciculus sp. E1-EBD-02]|uniref:tetratricopeptide repeat protein n=1 Tax=Coleofasciculus sp. E1-EBD-02 TaxID=3068481 RepID=UPI0033010292